MGDVVPILSDEQLLRNVQRLSSKDAKDLLRAMIEAEWEKTGNSRIADKLKDRLFEKFMRDGGDVSDGWEGQP